MPTDQLLHAEMDYFAGKFGVAQYQLASLNLLLSHVDIRAATVLEVGGSNLPRELVIGRLGAGSWHCVDMIPGGHYGLRDQAVHYALERIKPLSDFHPLHLAERYNIFDGMIQHTAALPAGHFDVAVSIASFEHINDLALALLAIRRLLRPGGVLFSNFGPIWSCRVGHHIWVDEELNFHADSAIPPFSHLLYSREALLAMLTGRFDARRAAEAVAQMFDRDFINRLFYEDYELLVHGAGFSMVETAPSWEQEVDPALQTRLEAQHPGRHRFDAYNMKIVCRT